MSLILITLLFIALAFGCSTVSNPALPDSEGAALVNNEVDHPEEAIQGGNIIGVYGFEFDEEAVALYPVPLRDLEMHVNVTSWLMPPGCGGVGCLKYNLVSWDPVNRILGLNADIENPTNLTAYDVRLVFQHFILRQVLNVDSYTNNFDPAANINPFIAFSKASTSRQFGALATITEVVKIHWPLGSGGFMLNIVEAMWPGHCYEPYEINNISTTGPIVGAATTDVFCDVLDWQNDVAVVTIDTTPITGGTTNMTYVSGNTWKATVGNTVGAASGDYKCLITGRSPDPSSSFEKLYHYVIIKIRKNKFKEVGTYPLQPGQCSTDIGVIGNAAGTPLDSHILISGTDPNQPGICDAIDKFTAYYGAPAMYKSLVNLDPANGSYQPWPLERIDATYDGAAGWNNYNAGLMYIQPGYTPAAGVSNHVIYSNIDRNANFTWAWPNDHRHFDPTLTMGIDYFPIDVCDDFKRFQFALWIDYINDVRPVGLERWPGGNYQNNDCIYYTSFGPLGFVGTGPGKVEPGNDINGIDAWQMSYSKCRMFILENGSDWAVEAFDITNTAANWGFDQAQWAFQIPMPESIIPIDCELLPVNSNFAPNKVNPTLCVLVKNVVSGWGDIYFYDASNGAYLNSLTGLGIGLTTPPIMNKPLYIDNDDGHFEIHVMQSGPLGPQVTVYKWI